MINTPFNYTGGKYKLLEQLLPEFDYTKKYFVDLFAGGGSVYTNIVDKYDKVLVNDILIDLIGIHKELVNNSDNLVENVKSLCPVKGDKDGYNKLRESYNQSPSADKLWALMLCSTNNMLRFNKKFKYNQTYGQRLFNSSTQKKVDEFVEHITKYKDKIIFVSKHFNDIKINKSSMVYIDSPYTGSGAGYNCYWNSDDDYKLYKYCKNLDNTGSSFMLSGILGEHTKGKRWLLIDDLIKDGYKYKILNCNYEKVARNKNSKNSNEIIIMNY
jgi:DNA adenine methylase Dam